MKDLQKKNNMKMISKKYNGKHVECIVSYTKKIIYILY